VNWLVKNECYQEDTDFFILNFPVFSEKYPLISLSYEEVLFELNPAQKA
jgi:hypothetical protein